MAQEFDDQMDALLRSHATHAASSGSALDAMAAGSAGHLDADELSAFREGVVPEPARRRLIAHLADCGRCRTSLSTLSDLHSGEAAWAPDAPVPVATVRPATLPWYRRIFAFPQLAYVLGGLLVVFAGAIAITVLQDDRMTVADVRSGRIEEQAAPAAAANAVANTNTLSTDPTAIARSVPQNTVSETVQGSGVLQSVEDSRTANTAAAAPKSAADNKQAPLQPSPVAVEDQTLTRAEPPVKPAKNPENERRETAARSVSRGEPASPPAVAAARVEQRTESYDAAPAERKAIQPYSAENTTARRAVAGKTFIRRDGVWYDQAYSGQQTTNVRRNSGEYKKLDAAVREAAGTLSGTVVIVSGGKAFRID